MTDTRPEVTVPQRRIVCAACRDSAGRVALGPRHFDSTMRETMQLWARQYAEPLEQGFIDQFGEFLSREEAWAIAVAAGQIIRRVGGDEGRLYSENIY